jgi:hypothetical protein
MPTRKEAKQAFEAMSKDPNIYFKMSEEGKRAAWNYGKDNGYYDRTKLTPTAQAEYDKYSSKFSQYEPQSTSSTIQDDLRVDKYARINGVKAPLKENVTTLTPVKTPMPKLSPTQQRVNAELQDEPKQPLQVQPQTTRTTKTGNKITPQAKIASKDLVRPDNPFAPALVNFANTASLGLLERNTDAIKDLNNAPKDYGFSDATNKKIQTASNIGGIGGTMAGYLTPFGAVKGAVVKGGQTIGKRLLTDAAIGVGIDTTNELVKDKNNIDTSIKNIATNAAFGILADGALSGLGKAFKGIQAKYGKNIPKEIVEVIQKADELEKKGDYDSEEYYAMISYLDEVNRQSPAYIKKEAQFQAPKVNSFKTMTKTVGQPEKTIIQNIPITKEVPKVSIRKENIAMNDEEKYLSKAIKEAGITTDDFITETQTAIKQIEDNHLAYLRNTGGQGVEKGGIYRDDMGKVKGAFGKSSNNPEWYREFYALNKRKPTVAEMKEITLEHLTKGFGDKFDNIPANDEYIRLRQDLEKYVALRRKSELQPLAKPNNVYEEISTSNTTQKGLQPTQKLIPSTLHQEPQLLKPNKPIIEALGNRINKPYVEPLLKQNAQPKAPQTPLQPLKPTADTNTQPIIKSGLKPNVDEIGEDLLNDATYKELTDELKGVNISSDNNIKSIATSIKDKSGLSLNMKDVYRNMRDAFGKNFDYVKTNYLDKFDASKKAYTDEVKNYTDNIYDKVVKGLKINKGTKESAAIQNFGEGLTTKEKLVEDFGEQRAKDIMQADTIFRQVYDELIDKVNATRSIIYPNNAEKIVPKRNDYYRHFNEMAEGFAGLRNIFDTPSQIDPKLAGMSEFTKPGSKWASYMQKRGDGEYTADAVGGFLEYIQPASYSIHIDPHINKFRGLAKDIAEATQKTKNANTTILYLTDFANSLAGKTNSFDRPLLKLLGEQKGRQIFNAVNWLNGRVKSNQVLGNASSALSQFANVPIGIARIKYPQHLAKGLGQTLAGVVGKGNKAMKQSQFVNERKIGDLISRFDKKMINQPKKFAAWILGGADKLGTNFIWNSAYNTAVAKGNLNPVKYADDMARSIVAGRGIGEVPLLQQAKTFQLIAPFQLEVANLWSVMGDSVKEKDFAAIVMLLAGNYMFNNVTEETTGNRVTFDPINAMIEALGEEDTNAGKVAGRMAGEVLSNIPLGQTLAAQYPEYGADISTPLFKASLPSRAEFFGDEDPTRFGGGLLVTKALTDPLYKLAAPFGGSQAKKTIEGLQAVNKGMVEKDGKMSFPVAKNTKNTIQSALFGKNSTDEARQYFDEDRRPLSEKQTQALLKKPDVKAEYEKLMDKRRTDTINDKIKAIKKDTTLSWEEQQKLIKKLMQELNNIRKN